MLSGSQVQIDIQYIILINAGTGEGLPEGVEWLTGTARDTAYLLLRAA